MTLGWILNPGGKEVVAIKDITGETDRIRNRDYLSDNSFVKVKFDNCAVFM